MKAIRTLFGLLVVLSVLTLLTPHIGYSAPSERAMVGFFTASGRIYDARGGEVVMRGVNVPHAWYPQQTASALRAIKRLGANTARVVLSSGHRWRKTPASEVTQIIEQCKANRLLCVLEVHDTTGYGEQPGAASLDQAVRYWLSLKPVLMGQEAFVIINVGNEPYGNRRAYRWVRDTIQAIRRLRRAGFKHALMVDAPNWGQDWQHIMLRYAPRIYAADPMRNVIFSVHMYGVYNRREVVASYLKAFVERGLPLVIGEFGWNHTDGDPDEDAIMALADAYGIGYIAWSWSGNSGGVEYLDLVSNFDPNRLTPWGQRFVDGPNGLHQSIYTREITVFNQWNGGKVSRGRTIVQASRP